MFGSDITGEQKLLEFIYTLPKLDLIDAREILNCFYEDTYGFYKHFIPDKSKPLSSVAMHRELEDINQYSLVEESMDTYVKHNINSIFGLDYVEYVSLPRDICQMLIEVSNKEATRKNAMVDSITKDLK